MKQEQHAWIGDGENKRAIQCIEWCVSNLKQTKVWWIFLLNAQSPVTIVSVECDETVSWYFLVDAVSRIYELVNAIIHLLDERSPYWLGIPMIYLHLCACVCVSDKRLLPYQAASTWTLHFRCAIQLLLVYHSFHSFFATERDITRWWSKCGFFATILIPNAELKWKAFGYFVDSFSCMLLCVFASTKATTTMEMRLQYKWNVWHKRKAGERKARSEYWVKSVRRMLYRSVYFIQQERAQQKVRINAGWTAKATAQQKHKQEYELW